MSLSLPASITIADKSDPDTCKKCGHHRQYHFHDEKLWKEEVYEEEVVDEDTKAKFDAAKGVEAQKQELLKGIQTRIDRCEANQQNLGQKLLDNIQKFEQVAVSRSYALLLQNQRDFLRLSRGNQGPTQVPTCKLQPRSNWTYASRCIHAGRIGSRAATEGFTKMAKDKDKKKKKKSSSEEAPAAAARAREPAKEEEDLETYKTPGRKQPKQAPTRLKRKIADLENLGRSGGVYVPPFKLARMQKEIEDKTSAEYQRQTWEALRKSINGLVNKVNVGNIKNIVEELFQENLVRGRGLLVRALIRAQMASPGFTHVFAALLAVINSKLPEVGDLLIRRVILQFRRAYKRTGGLKSRFGWMTK
eukprot:s3672_g4.t1